ncbi:MAG: hypothetical protein LBL60_03365 [Mycoplasmataceae bacterium]|nr:hypothetical protein [Mycoplasmataceae bacterium]
MRNYNRFISESKNTLSDSTLIRETNRVVSSKEVPEGLKDLCERLSGN